MKRKVPTRRMRQHPDLEQLKRQAKELLQAFVSGDPPTIAEVNAHYRAADPSKFALHDAQLARLSHFKPIFGRRARKFLLLSTSALRKATKTG